MRMNETLLWLFVINLGVAFGAGLYEHRITVPRWITSLPERAPHVRLLHSRDGGPDEGARFIDVGRGGHALVAAQLRSTRPPPLSHSQGFGFSVRSLAKMPSFIDATIRFARAAGSRPVKI